MGCSWSLVFLLKAWLVILSTFVNAKLVPADIPGFISIDCGLPEDSAYEDNGTEIRYASDAEYINTGVNMQVSSVFVSETLQKAFVNVRSFPLGMRNCYTLKPPEGKGNVYFIRASFMYGNYDEQNHLPEFDLYLGVNLWESLKFDNASHILIKEIIHVPLTDEIHVCLLNTGRGTPFISILEVRHFPNSTYGTEQGSLVLYKRYDVGSTTNRIFRYKEDVYDRMWFPYNIPGSVLVVNSPTTDTWFANNYTLPPMVMMSAVRPTNANDSLDFEFDGGDSTLEFYAYLHFALLERPQNNQGGEFNVYLNGDLWIGSVLHVRYHRSNTIYSTKPIQGPKLYFSIQKTENSTVPPILNAVEIYIVKDFQQEPTSQEDVTAIMDVKSSYGISKNWQGDPCLPVYSWVGVNCSDNGYHPPNIISLNLKSSGLIGSISSSLSELHSLQFLDLSNNSLTGSLPDFLSQLKNLRTLNLSGNKLFGSVPLDLMARYESGILLLSVDGNPDLCLASSCKEDKKNFIVPLIATSVSLLVIISLLAILWRFRRRRGQAGRTQEANAKLKSNNRQFTYSEVINMTDNFQRIIGKGGSGTVYFGYLDDGSQVAVKMLSASSTHGDEQFRTEAELLMRVHHRNLASFLGYCNEGQNIAIIYEYMASGNLEKYLSDKTKDALSWKDRLRVAVDAAQGLEYLHYGCKPPIIHRDVKTANILLNEEKQARITDFGFSKAFSIDSESHLSTRVVGTMGYLDPEYFRSNRLTEKSDVYSFGIVLLELITGHPVKIKGPENIHIVQWVTPFIARGDIRSIVDARIQENFDTNSVWKALEIAMACVPALSIQRPTMSHVVVELKECYEVEIARKKPSESEEQLMRSSNSIYMNPIDPELEMGPQPR